MAYVSSPVVEDTHVDPTGDGAPEGVQERTKPRRFRRPQSEHRHLNVAPGPVDEVLGRAHVGLPRQDGNRAPGVPSSTEGVVQRFAALSVEHHGVASRAARGPIPTPVRPRFGSVRCQRESKVRVPEELLRSPRGRDRPEREPLLERSRIALPQMREARRHPAGCLLGAHSDGLLRVEPKGAGRPVCIPDDGEIVVYQHRLGVEVRSAGCGGVASDRYTPRRGEARHGLVEVVARAGRRHQDRKDHADVDAAGSRFTERMEEVADLAVAVLARARIRHELQRPHALVCTGNGGSEQGHQNRAHREGEQPCRAGRSWAKLLVELEEAPVSALQARR